MIQGMKLFENLVFYTLAARGLVGLFFSGVGWTELHGKLLQGFKLV